MWLLFQMPVNLLVPIHSGLYAAVVPFFDQARALEGAQVLDDLLLHQLVGVRIGNECFRWHVRPF